MISRTRPASARVRLSGVALIGTIAAAAAAENWPNFRGPHHDGISRESVSAITWKEPPKPVWEREVGSGFSSFACVDGKLFTAGTSAGQQVVYCLNAANGEIVWQTPIEPEYPERMGGDGPRATPSVADGRVYMLGALGRLVCLEAESGKLVWDRQFNHVPQWGYSGSVLIEGENAIVSAGESDGALVALNRKTGEPVWKSGDDPVGYATPYPFTHDDVRYIAGFTGVSAIIARADNGEIVYRLPWKTDWNVNASAPIYHDGHLLFSSGYRHGAIVLKLRTEGARLAADKAWESDTLRNKFQSCLLKDGVLYTCDETGLKCVEFKSGKIRWEDRRAPNGDAFAHGTVAMAGDRLFILSEAGTLFVASATPDGFKPLAQAQILSPRCWTVSVICDGKLYARNLERVICLDLSR